MKTNRYLVLRRVRGYAEYDEYDCYHETTAEIGIPTDCVVNLTTAEHKLLQESSKYIFIPIVTHDEVKQEIADIKEKAKEKAKAEAEKKRKKEAAALKRQETQARKKRERELAKLQELQEKYGQ